LYRKALIVSKKSDLKKKKFVVVSLTTALLFLVASVSNIWAFYLLHFDSAVPVNYELVGDYKIPQNVYQDYERKVSGGENYASLELKYCTGYGQAFVISENYHFASAKYYYSLSGKLAYQLDLSDTSPISYGIGESLSKMKCESLKNFNNGGIPKVELPV
jgi:hypothetical protein